MAILLPAFLWLKSKMATHGKGIALGLAWLIWICEIIQTCVTSLASKFAELFGLSGSFSSFQNINFSGLQLIGYVNAIIPLSEFVGLMTIYVTAWTLVIIFRWVKSLMPTVSN
jgi:hypothetical protein